MICDLFVDTFPSSSTPAPATESLLRWWEGESEKKHSIHICLKNGERGELKFGKWGKE
jgi:hypothetical protein